jgi:23S rRNA (cytidine2498-2'-O)-methyltransferase
VLHICQPGFEPFLAKELNLPSLAKGPGWVRTAEAPAAELCFAHYSLRDEEEVSGVSGRQLAQGLSDYFLRTSKGLTYDGAWPLVVEAGGVEGAGKRAHTVEKLFLELAKKRVSRVVKLAVSGRPELGQRKGLFAYLTGLDRLFVSREASFGGQRRMSDDPRAPSRSYLKVEEAYGVLGAAPSQGETVVDLGAAPGGWSYSAARRGARIIAVDNGPLKGGALGHALISHRAEDAFKFQTEKVDWLFCDMVEDPDRVLELVGRWLKGRWCERFIVNLKFGRIDPLPLLRRARALEAHCAVFRARHLFHDREEITLVGQLGTRPA